MEEKFYLEKDRIQVFIGKAGSKKREIEKKLECKIDVDSSTGEVFVNCDDGYLLFVLKNIILAINYGFNPDKALKLYDESFVLDIIDVKRFVKDSEKVKVVLGRVIGKSGATREIIEQISKCYLSINSNNVCVIGPYENTLIVVEALEMLIKGSSHKSLYSYLEKNKTNFNDGLI